jgi:hypothetical protein
MKALGVVNHSHINKCPQFVASFQEMSPNAETIYAVFEF